MKQEKNDDLIPLSDISESGKEKPWKEKKLANVILKEIYRTLYEDRENSSYNKKASRLDKCGVRLYYNVFKGFKENKEGLLEEKVYEKLKTMESCRVRLCPLCAWRRARKIHSHVRKIIDAVEKEKEYAYLMLTLTVPNCKSYELSDCLDKLLDGIHSLMKYKRVKSAVKGWYRGLEITHNVNTESKSYDTYHPHFHMILAVDKSYFTDQSRNGYIPHGEWLGLWQKAMKDPTITQVNIKRVTPDKSKGQTVIGAVCEVTKYTVKESDYVLPYDWDLSCDAVATLDFALNNRRLVAFGGIMKKWHKKLNLDDEVDGDLIHDDDSSVGDELIGVNCYVWNVGYQQYFLFDEKNGVYEKKSKRI